MAPGQTVYVLTKDHCCGSYGDGPCFTVVGVFADPTAAQAEMYRLAVDTGVDARRRAAQWVVDRVRMADRPGLDATSARAYRAQVADVLQTYGLPPDATAAQVVAHLDADATRARVRAEVEAHVAAYAATGAYGYSILEEVVQ